MACLYGGTSKGDQSLGVLTTCRGVFQCVLFLLFVVPFYIYICIIKYYSCHENLERVCTVVVHCGRCSVLEYVLFFKMYMYMFVCIVNSFVCCTAGCFAFSRRSSTSSIGDGHHDSHDGHFEIT